MVCEWTLFNSLQVWFWFLFTYLFSGLDKKIIKVLLLNQLFSYQSSLLKKNPAKIQTFLIWILLWTIIFPRRNKKKRENLHVMKKQTLSLSVQLCLVRCEKIQNRDSPENKQKKVRALFFHPWDGKYFPTPLFKKSTSLVFSAEWKIKRCVRMAFLDGEISRFYQQQILWI